jgi:protein-arginine kinase activator protein McsA
MIHAKYTIECEKCRGQISGAYDVKGTDIYELKTIEEFIADFSFEFIEVDGKEKLLCPKCAGKFL